MPQQTAYSVLSATTLFLQQQQQHHILKGRVGARPWGINRVRLTSPSPPPRRRIESSAFMGSTGR